MGYYDFPLCIPCDCNVNGTAGQVCLPRPGAGGCPCKPYYTGTYCDRCRYGYYGFPQCKCKLVFLYIVFLLNILYNAPYQYFSLEKRSALWIFQKYSAHQNLYCGTMMFSKNSSILWSNSLLFLIWC